jgi:hypothetical protein
MSLWAPIPQCSLPTPQLTPLPQPVWVIERASERGSPDVNLSYYSTQHKFYCLLLSRLLLPLLLLPLLLLPLLLLPLLLLPLLLLWQTGRPPTCASCLRSSTAWIAHIDMDQKSKNSLIEILKTLN